MISVVFWLTVSYWLTYFCQGITSLGVIADARRYQLINFDKFIFMAKINSLCISALLALGFANFRSQQFSKPGNDEVEPSSAFNAIKASDTLNLTKIKSLFTLLAAEKILGEPAHLADSGSTVPGIASKTSVNDSVLPIKKMAWSYRCAYEANVEDQKTGRTGKVYFVVEEYPQVSSAATVYSYYKRSNQTHPGFKERHDVGDEAWYGDSPYSIYVRKGNKLFGIKVNRPTSKTSLDGFNQVIKNIAAAF
jgi:hypothetical protein